MSKARHGKSTFFVVMMTLLICGVLAIGATYAYDTYENYTSVETQQTVTYQDVKFDLKIRKNGNYVSMLGENGAKAFTSDILWEPGKTEIVYLRVENNENDKKINCRVALEVPESTFGDALQYAVIKADTIPAGIDNWNEFNSAADKKGTLQKTGSTNAWYEFWNRTSVENVLLDSTEIVAEGWQDFILAIHMREDAGNDVKNASMSLDFTAAASHVMEPSVDNQGE